jgi:hypothetical protein
VETTIARSVAIVAVSAPIRVGRPAGQAGIGRRARSSDRRQDHARRSSTTSRTWSPPPRPITSASSRPDVMARAQAKRPSSAPFPAAPGAFALGPSLAVGRSAAYGSGLHGALIALASATAPLRFLRRGRRSRSDDSHRYENQNQRRSLTILSHSTSVSRARRSQRNLRRSCGTSSGDACGSSL